MAFEIAEQLVEMYATLEIPSCSKVPIAKPIVPDWIHLDIGDEKH